MNRLSGILFAWWSSLLREPPWSRGGGGAGAGAGGAAGGAARDRDRGDVPGWVMVTVMTAALVTALMIVAVPALRNVFTEAIDSVTGAGDTGGGG
jgi:hypothetical protein